MLNDIAECANEELILVGGTALALFHLKHRISIDLDFIPVKGDDIKLKENFKGCLTKKGYRTMVSAYKNQFVIQLENTSIKIEIFSPSYKLKNPEHYEFGNFKLLVASIDDLLELKKQSYADRKEARDLYDILFILKKKEKDFKLIKDLINKFGNANNIDEMKKISDESNYKLFEEVLNNASKTSD